MEDDERAERSAVIASEIGMEEFTSDMIAKMMAACEPEAYVELASLVSLFEMWRRMDLLSRN